jgi:hypothetical protein
MRSIVLHANDYQAVATASLSSLVSDSNIWQFHSFREGTCVSVPINRRKSRTVSTSDLVVFDAWLNARLISNSISAFPDTSDCCQAILDLPQVLNEQDCLQYRWGLRLLGSSVPADVCTMISGGSRAGRRKVNVFSGASESRHTVVEDLARKLANRIEKLPSVQTVVKQLTERPDRSATPTISAPRRLRLTQRRYFFVAAIILLVLAAAAVTRLVSVVQSSKNESVASNSEPTPAPVLIASHSDDIGQDVIAPPPSQEQLAIAVETTRPLSAAPSTTTAEQEIAQVGRDSGSNAELEPPKPDQIPLRSDIAPVGSNGPTPDRTESSPLEQKTKEERVAEARMQIATGVATVTLIDSVYVKEQLGPFISAVFILRDRVRILRGPREQSERERNEIKELNSDVENGIKQLAPLAEPLLTYSIGLLESNELSPLRNGNTDDRTLDELKLQRDKIKEFTAYLETCKHVLELLRVESPSSFQPVKDGLQITKSTIDRIDAEIDKFQRALTTVNPRIGRLEREIK